MHNKTTTTHADLRPSLPLLPASMPRRSGNADTTDARAASIAPERYQQDQAGDAALVTASEDIRTVREHLGWQLRATRVLNDLLTVAVRDALPRIGSTVGSVGANVAGHCYGRTGIERRREFDAWRAAVGAAPRPEITGFSGITHLRAIATRYDGLVDVVVLADIFPDDEIEADR